MVTSTIGTTIILIQFSQIVPINPTLVIGSPITIPKTAPNNMAANICVDKPIFLPPIFICQIPLYRKESSSRIIATAFSVSSLEISL